MKAYPGKGFTAGDGLAGELRSVKAAAPGVGLERASAAACAAAAFLSASDLGLVTTGGARGFSSCKYRHNN